MRLFLLILLLLTGISPVWAANPIISGYADPAMRVVDGKMYIAIGKDQSPLVKGFAMPYWGIISSDNLVDWKMETTIYPDATYMGAGNTQCWAPDLTRKGSKWYFYFSNWGIDTGVLGADAVAGPYADVLKKPLVPGPRKYDPTIFTDDGGKSYLIFGRDGMLNGQIIHYQIARLNDDMVSLAEAPRDLLTSEKYGFGAAKAARDHSYFHKHDGTYYLSCSGIYMTSKTIYGPYSNSRSTGQGGTHSSFIDYNGQSYHAWENSAQPWNVRTYRQVMMGYLHYKNNGDMVDDPNFLEGGKYYAYGVGNYDANWEKIEAEWFFAKSGGAKRESPAGGFEIQNLRNGNFLNFPKIANVAADSTIRIQVSSKAAAASRIEVRKDSPTGRLLGTVEVPPTASWETYQTVSTQLKNAAGEQNLFFVFTGGAGDLIHLDWFAIEPIKGPASVEQPKK